MFLNLFSVPELDFKESWEKGYSKIKKFPKFEKYMTIFWLFGPFIFLIERDPADLWLSLICIIFLIRCFFKKEWSWSKQWWFKFAFSFWIISLFSAIFSPDPLFSFQQGFVWFRFPLYAAAAQVWFGKDRDIRIIMLISIFLGMMIMCGILSAEMIFEPKNRLTWPYGDMIPGSYVSKFSLPLFCIFMAIAVSRINKASVASGVISIITVLVTLMSGERISFVLRVCSGLLAGLIWRPRYFLFLFLIFIQIVVISIIIVSKPNIADRGFDDFLDKIPIINMSDNNPYWSAWRGGISQGIRTPIIGIGPSGTRNTCKDLPQGTPTWLTGINYCGNHPHNFYIQLFAETGIIGLFFGLLMFSSIVYSCYKNRKTMPHCPMISTAFVVPLALFFPLQQFGSFFGQWGNLFIWFAVGFAISQIQDWKHTKN